MAIYIWLMYYGIVVYCTQASGCIQTSLAHFDSLVVAGSIELIFEMGGIIKIFARKFDIKNGNQKGQ